MKAKLLNLIEWALAIILLLAAAGVIYAVSTAHAGTVGDETVAQYRTWPDMLKSGYVSGVMASLTRHGNVGCAVPPTVSVMMAWLESNEVKLSDTIADAILNISVDKHGCRVRTNGRPGA